MHRTIISDTSCLIILTNIEELDLLQKLYGNIPVGLWLRAERITNTSIAESPSMLMIIVK
jgi:predicted nucleic acid-binding protein